jgi:flagellin
MPQTINTNLASLNAQRNLNTSQGALSTAMQRLSSGLRVNSARDDAAGLAIAERMTAQVRGMSVAVRNANDGVSLAQTVEGSLGKLADALQRMRELSVQAANASNSGSDKDSLDREFGEMAKEVQRVLGATTFNGNFVLGANAGTLSFQVGANVSSENVLTIFTPDMTKDPAIIAVAGTDIQGTGRPVIDSTADINAIHGVMTNIDATLDAVNGMRATLGASQSRFEAVISNLQVSIENQSAARGRIMDADFAAETAAMSRAQILQQAGNAMVAQANQLPQLVLKLLQG